jgi:hypothetical protein
MERPYRLRPTHVDSFWPVTLPLPPSQRRSFPRQPNRRCDSRWGAGGIRTTISRGNEASAPPERKHPDTARPARALISIPAHTVTHTGFFFVRRLRTAEKHPQSHVARLRDHHPSALYHIINLRLEMVSPQRGTHHPGQPKARSNHGLRRKR